MMMMMTRVKGSRCFSRKEKQVWKEIFLSFLQFEKRQKKRGKKAGPPSPRACSGGAGVAVLFFLLFSFHVLPQVDHTRAETCRSVLHAYGETRRISAYMTRTRTRGHA